MADEVDPRSGELTTLNYGWTKPNVGDSDDAWGGMLNSDLDGIDSTVKSVSNVANAAQTTANTANTAAGTAQTAANAAQTTANTAQTTANAALPIAGGTLTGPVVAAADPTAALGMATKQYVDGVRYGDNRIINGDMRIDQRGVASGAGGTAGGYTIDRWAYASSVATKGTWSRAASNLAGFPYQLQFISSSAYAVVAADYFVFQQPVEADMVSDFAWGTANAQSVTLSFWAWSSLTGTFGGSVQNYASNRSYPFSFSIPTASLWTRFVITIPGDTAGTWVMSGNAGSLYVNFSLGMGSTRSGPANAWAATNYLSVTGAVSVVATNGASFNFTGVKLEIGSIATPFNHPPLAQALAACQRYYYGPGPTLGTMFSGNVTNGNAYYALCRLPVSMRATPTVVLTNNNAVSFPSTVGTFSSLTADTFLETRTANATAMGYFASSVTASAEL